MRTTSLPRLHEGIKAPPCSGVLVSSLIKFTEFKIETGRLLYAAALSSHAILEETGGAYTLSFPLIKTNHDSGVHSQRFLSSDVKLSWKLPRYTPFTFKVPCTTTYCSLAWLLHHLFILFLGVRFPRCISEPSHYYTLGKLCLLVSLPLPQANCKWPTGNANASHVLFFH